MSVASVRFTGPSGRRGFTLLEILAAVSVLAIILYIMVQITNQVTRVVQSGRRVDAETEARLVFNRMALDFSRLLKSGDVDYSAFKSATSGTLPARYDNAAVPVNPQPGNDRLAFYAETSGLFSGPGPDKSTVALVAYQIRPGDAGNPDPTLRAPVLQRLAQGLGWEDTGAGWQSPVYLPMTLTGQWPDLFADDDDYQSIGSQTFRVEYAYLLKATGTEAARLSVTPWDTRQGHTHADGLKDVAAIVVTIGVLDETSRKIVEGTKFDALIEEFPDAVEGQALLPVWQEKINDPNFSDRTGVPPPASSRVRVYERYFYLHPGTP